MTVTASKSVATARVLMANEAPTGDVDGYTTQSNHSPIRILPPELLAEIFGHCASVETFSPVRLSHVSALWRHTAITTPSLWHSVSIKIPTATPRITSAKVRTWLARSGRIPLHISLVVIEWRDDDISFPLFHHLRGHSHHWGRLSLIAASYTVARHIFQFFTSLPHHDMLSRLDLSIGSASLTDPDDLTPLLIPEENEDERGCITVVVAGLMKTSAPRLTEFNLSTSALPYEWDLKTHVGFTHLRILRIFERFGPFAEIRASTVLQLLDKCPALEVFIFSGSNFFEPLGVNNSMVDLPRLRELHIAQTINQRAILAHLITPALQILRLSWLNRPEALIDESFILDPSEFSEAPTEWSQSPYTDLLTGAGIRSLIRCSTPPIRVLDMDYADARSPKDFIWMFERLPTLESFRITGSDMSDKVLNALAYKNNAGTWLCPRLKSLEFSRCDVITGAGVVALAKGRNPCGDHVCGESTEDVTAGQSRPARLSRFILEACAGVDCESVAVMQHLLNIVDFEVEVVPP